MEFLDSVCFVCDECTVPMPVSGGWAVFEAKTGAAFAPIAVAGGVSILGWRQKEMERGGEKRVKVHPFRNTDIPCLPSFHCKKVGNRRQSGKMSVMYSHRWWQTGIGGMWDLVLFTRIKLE